MNFYTSILRMIDPNNLHFRRYMALFFVEGYRKYPLETINYLKLDVG